MHIKTAVATTSSENSTSSSALDPCHQSITTAASEALPPRLPEPTPPGSHPAPLSPSTSPTDIPSDPTPQTHDPNPPNPLNYLSLLDDALLSEVACRLSGDDLNSLLPTCRRTLVLASDIPFHARWLVHHYTLPIALIRTLACNDPATFSHLVTTLTSPAAPTTYPLPPTTTLADCICGLGPAGSSVLHVAAAKCYDTQVLQHLLSVPGVGANVNVTSKAPFTGQIDWPPLSSPQAPPLHPMQLRCGREGMTPLYIAAERGNVEAVQALVSVEGVDVMAAEGHTGCGYMPLHIACMEGHVEVVQVLVEAASSVAGGTAVRAAAAAQPAAGGAGANGAAAGVVPAAGGAGGNGAAAGVVPATAGGNGAAAGVVPATAGGNGAAAGVVPAAAGRSVRLAAAADEVLNAPAGHGTTPLMLAVIADERKVAALLLRTAGVRVNAAAAADSHSTALHYAAATGNKAMVKLLLGTPGVEVNARTASGCTALHVAVRAGKVRVVEALLADPRVDMAARDNDAHTALHLAAMAKEWKRAGGPDRRAVLRAVLGAQGVDTNVGDAVGMSPLHLAALVGDADAVSELLLAAGVDANVSAPVGGAALTPLHLAAQFGHDEVVEVLLGVPGIDVNGGNDNGFTPLYVARDHGHARVARLLRGAGGRDELGWLKIINRTLAAANVALGCVIALQAVRLWFLVKRRRG